jgi:hypothetical protein
MLPRIVLLLAFMLLPSCAYLSNRARDAYESVLVDVQLGVGVSADAKAGPLAACVGCSGGFFAAGKSTWWSGVTTFKELSVGVPVLQVAGAVLAVTDDEPVGFALAGTHMLAKWAVPGFDPSSRKAEEMTRIAVLGITLPADRPMPNGFVDYFGIEAAAFAGVAGTRIGFNVAELGDFLLGWFGLDILGDDIQPEEKEQAAADTPTSAPEKTEERGTE